MLLLWIPLLPIYCLTQAAHQIQQRRHNTATRNAAWHNAIQAEHHH